MIALKLDLGNHLENFVKQQIEKGNYQSENELVKDALFNLERKKSLDLLKNAILEGEESGNYEELDDKIFLKEIKAKYVI